MTSSHHRESNCFLLDGSNTGGMSSLQIMISFQIRLVGSITKVFFWIVWGKIDHFLFKGFVWRGSITLSNFFVIFVAKTPIFNGYNGLIEFLWVLHLRRILLYVKHCLNSKLSLSKKSGTYDTYQWRYWSRRRTLWRINFLSFATFWWKFSFQILLARQKSSERHVKYI